MPFENIIPTTDTVDYNVKLWIDRITKAIKDATDNHCYVDGHVPESVQDYVKKEGNRNYNFEWDHYNNGFGNVFFTRISWEED